jgi:hypothetical protein
VEIVKEINVTVQVMLPELVAKIASSWAGQIIGY